MGRQKIHSYEQTVFAKRISLLQKKYGYTNDYIIDNLKDEKGNCLISDTQTYGNYKSGKRLPRDFPEIISAFSRFYDVTAGYLIGTEDAPNHQLKSIQDATGLSEASVKKLVNARKNSPEIIKVIDSIIPVLNKENIPLFFYFFQQMGHIYKNLGIEETDLISDKASLEYRAIEPVKIGPAIGFGISGILPSILTPISLLMNSFIKGACQLTTLKSRQKNQNKRKPDNQ